MSIDQIGVSTYATRALRAEPATVDLLVVVFDEDAYALRIAELATVQRTGEVAPFTHGGHACAGVTCVNGRLVVLHDLATLLGHRTGEQRFVAVSRFDPHAGIVMPPVDAYLRVPAAAILESTRSGTDPRIATIEHEGRCFTLLDLEQLLHVH